MRTGKKISTAIVSLLIVATLLTCFAVFGSMSAGAASGESKTETWYEVSTWADLKDALEVQGDPAKQNIRLTANIKEKSEESGTRYTTIASLHVYGTKILDLNGHSLIAEDLSNRYPNGMGSSSDGLTNTMFYVENGARMTVTDSEGGGKIRFLAGIPKREISQVVAQYPAYAHRDIFDIKNGGILILDGGTIEAGESQKMWVTNLLSFDETGWQNTIHHTGYMHHVNWGTAVIVEDGGRFYMNSGRIEGAGQDQCAYGSKKAINDAALEVEAGGFVHINGGTVLGYGGADCVKAKKGCEFTVAGGSFITEKYDWNRGIESDEGREFKDEYNLGSKSFYIQRCFEGEYGYIGVPETAFDKTRVTVKQNAHEEGEYERDNKMNLYITPKTNGITKVQLTTRNAGTQGSNAITYVPNESLKVLFPYEYLYAGASSGADYNVKYNWVVEEKIGGEWKQVSKVTLGDLRTDGTKTEFDLKDIYNSWKESKEYRVAAFYEEVYRCGETNVSSTQRSFNYILVNTVKALTTTADWKVKPAIGAAAEVVLGEPISDAVYTWKMALNLGDRVEWVVIAETKTPTYTFKPVEGKYNMLGAYVRCDVSSASHGGVITLDGVILQKQVPDETEVKMPKITVSTATYNRVYLENTRTKQEYVVTDSPFEPSDDIWQKAQKGNGDSIVVDYFYHLDTNTLNYTKQHLQSYTDNYFLHTRLIETESVSSGKSIHEKFSTSDGYPVDFVLASASSAIKDIRTINMGYGDMTVYYIYVPYGKTVSMPIYFSPSNSTYKNIGISFDANSSQTGSTLSIDANHSVLTVKGNAISGVDFYDISIHSSPTADRGERGWTRLPSVIAVVTYVESEGIPPYTINYDNFEHEEVTVEVGEELNIAPYARPCVPNGSYTSSDPSVVSVKALNEPWIKANKVGDATITFAYTTATREGGSVTLKVHVVASKSSTTYDSDFAAHNLVPDGDPTEATCTEPSYQNYRCTDVGCTFTCQKEVTPAHGHHESAPAMMKMLKTVSKNIRFDDNCHWHVCTDCGAVYGMEGHTEDAETCEVCGFSKAPVCEHETLVFVPEVIPTAESHNHGFAAHYECEACGKAFADENGETAIDATNYYDYVTTSGDGHIYADDNEKSAYSYDEEQHWQICIICGYVKTGMTDHSFEWKVKSPATCTQKGVQVYACTVCGYEYDEEEIDEIDHVPSGRYAVCGEGGRHCEVCNNCGGEIEGTETECTGDWIVDVEPTCDFGGTRHKVCTVCGSSQEEVNYTETKGHSWLSTRNDVAHWEECVYCHEVKFSMDDQCYYIPHNMVLGYDEDGHYVYCSSCMYPFEPLDGPEPIEHNLVWKTDELGHEMVCTECDYHGRRDLHEKEDAVTQTYTKIKADCLTEGVSVTVTVCPDCGYVWSKSEENIGLGAHDFTTATSDGKDVWIDEVAATGEKTGTKGHYHCALCDKNFDQDKNEIADLTIEKLPVAPFVPDKDDIVKENDVQSIVVDEAVARDNGVNVSDLFAGAKDENDAVAVTVGGTSIVFDSNAVDAIGGATVTLKVNTVSENAAEKVEGAKLVIEITLDGATFANGEATVKMPFNEEIPEGKVAKVYYVDAEGNKTDMKATFENGEVVFKTNHFSTYAVIFEDASGLSAGAVVGIVLACVAVLLIGAYFILGFLFYKKGKLTGNFFAKIYCWIK